MKLKNCCDLFLRNHEGDGKKIVGFVVSLYLLREAEITFISFSVFQLIFDTVYVFSKGNKAADRDLITVSLAFLPTSRFSLDKIASSHLT